MAAMTAAKMKHRPLIRLTFAIIFNLREVKSDVGVEVKIMGEKNRHGYVAI